VSITKPVIAVLFLSALAACGQATTDENNANVSLNETAVAADAAARAMHNEMSANEAHEMEMSGMNGMHDMDSMDNMSGSNMSGGNMAGNSTAPMPMEGHM
jgi:hypothetical protein